MLPCYIINLDRAKDRWDEVSGRFQSVGFNVIRVPAVDGRELRFPHPDFAQRRYFWLYGRPPVGAKIACFLSHIKALKTFLESDAQHALICEDDVFPK
ncbi:MAG: glycosyltransferase family 25 protein, partial [Planctomycetaceae bacterium]|nr:glycosyltransferase family 25 protein [Planctomycetaceae bacterium]